MLRMIEVVGVSEISYENAVKNAINELISNNYNIHFFNVIEHRGSYRDEKIQFQAVLKVAVDFVKKMNNNLKVKRLNRKRIITR
ncbi:MAG: dodecin domain-containing protein [Candidatus Cloacimonetes bacterium]|nr:dodecin domain-containing protein [Candidatus Cloacimonadota bacterium]